MEELGWIIAKIKCKMGLGGKPTLVNYLRNKGITIGVNGRIFTNIKTAEPYLIEIGDNVTISHSVDFITHDNSVCKIYGMHNDIYGRIKVGDNCFIGAHAIIMYGVTIADNVIVAAGSVVSKSITESNVIVAGCPARVIGTWDKYGEKVKNNVVKLGNLPVEEKRTFLMEHDEILIKR